MGSLVFLVIDLTVFFNVLLQLGSVEPFEFVLAEDGPSRHDQKHQQSCPAQDDEDCELESLVVPPNEVGNHLT